MVIERFKENAAPEIYRRLREKSRMMSEGLNYVSSWIDHQLKTCWQVMENRRFRFARALDRQLERLDGFRDRPGSDFGRGSRDDLAKRDQFGVIAPYSVSLLS